MAEESNIYLSMDQIFINIRIIDDDDEEESVQLKTHFWGYYAIPSVFSVSGKAANQTQTKQLPKNGFDRKLLES